MTLVLEVDIFCVKTNIYRVMCLISSVLHQKRVIKRKCIIGTKMEMSDLLLLI